MIDLIIRFLIWLAHFNGPPRVITGVDDPSPYLTRYFLFRHSTKTEGMDRHDNPPRWGLYLHRFHRGDQDRELHNHPWKWAVSFVLKGGYSEERRGVCPCGWRNCLKGDPVIRRRVRPLTFNFLRGNDFHRVDLDNGDAWTLFLVGPVVQSWGFWNRQTNVFTPWKKFLGLPE